MNSPILQHPPRHQHANQRHYVHASVPVQSSWTEVLIAGNEIEDEHMPALGRRKAKELRGLFLLLVDGGKSVDAARATVSERAQQLVKGVA